MGLIYWLCFPPTALKGDGNLTKGDWLFLACSRLQYPSKGKEMARRRFFAVWIWVVLLAIPGRRAGGTSPRKKKTCFEVNCLCNWKWCNCALEHSRIYLKLDGRNHCVWRNSRASYDVTETSLLAKQPKWCYNKDRCCSSSSILSLPPFLQWGGDKSPPAFSWYLATLIWRNLWRRFRQRIMEHSNSLWESDAGCAAWFF